MNKTITYAVYNRPTYLALSLDHLIKNDLRNWKIFFSIDPSPETNHILEIIEEKLGKVADYSLKVNETRLGVELNTYTSLATVFNNESDINIYLEDDIIVSPDITQIADWYFTLEKKDMICLNLLYGSCGGKNHKSSDKENIFYKTTQFNSLGYILTKEQWLTYFKDYWIYHDRLDINNPFIAGWDWSIFYHHIKNQKLFTLQPDYARSNHIGRENGTFCSPMFHDKVFSSIKILSQRKSSDNYKIIDL